MWEMCGPYSKIQHEKCCWSCPANNQTQNIRSILQNKIVAQYIGLVCIDLSRQNYTTIL